MIIVPSLVITGLVLAFLIALSTRGPKVAGNTIAILLSPLIAWAGGATVGIWGLGLLFMLVFPLFILPTLALINRQIPWILTLLLGTITFTGIAGVSIRYNNYDHWKQFGGTYAEFMAKLWEGIGFIAGCTFGIALIVTLICLGVRKLRER